MNNILQSVNSPSDLRKLSESEISQLAEEIRHYLVDTVSRTGGHLAPNLGVVELTIAIHLALDCPRDKIVWDVGHQSYVHKLLTGRREAFGTLRQQGGMSGFPKPSESKYDSFATGHSSTSISAALGMALARDKARQDHTVLAVIGDGALGGGMAFEALNHAGHAKTDLIVILNDNEMSISRSVGALAGVLGSARTHPSRRRFRSGFHRFVMGIPIIGKAIRAAGHRLKKSVKSFVLPGMVFEELGFTYLGPIDGHNVRVVRRAIEDAKRARGPVLIHAITRKGKGYAPAEQNPAKFHGTGPFVVETGIQVSGGQSTFTSYFSEFMMRAGREDDRIVAITAAMAEGTGLRSFAEAFPDRFYDVGIAEQHAVTFAAGLASAGLRPVVAIYSTFLQRAYDQIVHDVALQGLPVVFAVDRAGIVGEDGATHQGVLDLGYLRQIPGMTVMAPKDGAELCNMFKLALEHDGPSAIRYPKAAGSGIDGGRSTSRIHLGKAEVLRDGTDCTIFAVGPMAGRALEASRILSTRGVSCAVVNPRFVKPIDVHTLRHYAETTRTIITCEDSCLAGGFGSAVLESMLEAGLSDVHVVRLGVPDDFVGQGIRDVVLSDLGLDAKGIVDAVLRTASVKGSKSSSGGGLYVSTS